MWLSSLESWEKDDALPLHKNLHVMILALAHWGYTKNRKQAKVVPWLLSYLHRVDYWATSRPDLLRWTGLECAKLKGFYIEYRNSLISQNIPPNAPVSFEALRAASCAVPSKHAFRKHMGNLHGKTDIEDACEVATKRVKLDKPALCPTLEKVAANFTRICIFSEALTDAKIAALTGTRNATCGFADKQLSRLTGSAGTLDTIGADCVR